MNKAFFHHAKSFIGRLWRDQSGQDLIEYSLLVASVALLVYGALPGQYSTSLSHIWSRVNSTLVLIGNA
jgi:Flp pilus assembly pilin Flp